MGKLNNRAIYNGDVKIPTSGVTVEYNYDSVPDLDTTPIQSIDYDEMDHFLEFFHSEHDEDLLGNSPASYCSSPHETEKYLQMLRNNCTQS